MGIISINKLVTSSFCVMQSNAEYPNLKMPLCFTAESDEAAVGIVAAYNEDMQITQPFASLQISLDEQKTWTEWDYQMIPLTKGQKVYVKALNDNPYGMVGLDEKGIKGHEFIFKGKVAASGNVQYLLSKDGSRMDVPENGYAYLFAGLIAQMQPGLGLTTITKAPLLPATTLELGCYGFMFSGCTSLTSAPELPATTLADRCYYGMFRSCTSLTSAPELPAKTLTVECYEYMFQDCISLIQAPELPATTLDNNCYSYMFNGCASLTTAPKLPAMTLDTQCYQYMFGGCTSLTQAPELPATNLATYCYSGMFYNSGVTSVDMKKSVNGVYNPLTHGTLSGAITINYILD